MNSIPNDLVYTPRVLTRQVFISLQKVEGLSGFGVFPRGNDYMDKHLFFKKLRDLSGFGVLPHGVMTYDDRVSEGEEISERKDDALNEREKK
jgi:hypothetical protein